MIKLKEFYITKCLLFLLLLFVVDIYTLQSICYSENEKKEQISYGDNATNIMANTVTIEELKTTGAITNKQYKELKQGMSDIYSITKRIEEAMVILGKKSNHVDEVLSEIKSKPLSKLNERSEVLLSELGNNISSMKERIDQVEKSYNNEVSKRVKLSESIIINVRKLFVKMIDEIDTISSSLDKENKLGLRFERKDTLNLFAKETRGEIVRLITFKNGSKIEIYLMLGHRSEKGLVRNCPSMKFRYKKGNKELIKYQIKEKTRGRTITFVGPLVDMPKKQKLFKDIEYSCRVLQ